MNFRNKRPAFWIACGVVASALLPAAINPAVIVARIKSQLLAAVK